MILNTPSATYAPFMSSTVPQVEFPRWLVDVGQALLALAILLGISLVVLLITRTMLLPLLRRLIKKTRFAWDDVFLDASTFRWLGYILPAVVFALATDVLQTSYFESLGLSNITFLEILQDLAKGFIVLCLLKAVNALLTATNIIYSRRTESRSRPIKGFVQLAKIFVTIIGSICAIALMFGEAPWGFLQYAAGLTAVMMFVFKDTIMSLVASIQLTSNNMIQVGDWVEVPSCGADGDVIDVALHTVKVQNFDKTIVTVPTLKLVDGAFKNWRGMQESGGRRIKRDIHIDLSTVRFLESADLTRLGKFDVIKDYIAEKKKVLTDSNKSGGKSGPNFRQLTNIGTFRAYIIGYLKSLPEVHGSFTFLVRQLQPTDLGLPIQIYIFTDTTAWVEYEGIQSDIFDHLLAIVPEFDLRVYQQPSGHDVVSSLGTGGS